MLRIKKEIYEEMLKHCIDCLPYEACGILAGKDNLVTEIYKIKNIESSSVSYFMEPKEQLKAMKDIRQRGLEMVAIFHSHPFGSAYPSQKDLELAFYDVYYIIVSIEPIKEISPVFADRQEQIFKETKINLKCFKIKENYVNEKKILVG
jgi:proteasome lid subunit RPN8/RPN11